jgi:hypothetical protein
MLRIIQLRLKEFECAYVSVLEQYTAVHWLPSTRYAYDAYSDYVAYSDDIYD